jgi:hypothetical protein
MTIRSGVRAYDDSRPGRHKQDHAACCAQLNVIQIDAHHGICPNGVGFFLEFVKGRPACIPQGLLNSFRASSDDVANTCEEVLENIHPEGAFGRYDLDPAGDGQPLGVGFGCEQYGFDFSLFRGSTICLGVAGTNACVAKVLSGLVQKSK